MAIVPKYPGVYIEELPSSVRPIVGASTSVTAFVGSAPRGIVDTAVLIHSWADYERRFGGLNYTSTMSYAVYQYFQNGGSDAIIVRVHNGGRRAQYTASAEGGGNWLFEATSPGAWGDRIGIYVDHATRSGSSGLFNLTIEEEDGDGNVVTTETYYNLSADPSSSTYAPRVLADDSKLINVSGTAPATRPVANSGGSMTSPVGVARTLTGLDGSTITDTQVTGSEAARTGMYALLETDIFNLLCLPHPSRDGERGTYGSRWTAGLALCKLRRATLIVDPLSDWAEPDDANAAMNDPAVGLTGLIDQNAAVYFPRLKLNDPLLDNRVAEFAPCGAVAGVMARTDSERGVWKAPAGIEARIVGGRGVSFNLTDAQNGDLNPLGINCIRTFPVVGTVVWGARTLAGADLLASQWKYVPIRRLALFMEETLYRGTKWVVFEPNDENLWSQIRLNVGAFMHNLFRQGAFQGTSPQDAYLVKCDADTTTQDDRDRGIVNILVGFAPLKPAEFVIIKLQQLTAQAAA